MPNSNSKSFKSAAQQILSNVSEPLTAKEITEIALEKGLLETEGLTPEASMAAQLYVDIKNPKSFFKKVGKGKFTVKTQTDSVTTPLFLIEKQNSLVRDNLRNKLHEMDPFQFEYFIGELLEKIGYENVEVTKRSGDKGIDVTANLTLNGITDVKTIVQIKRFKEGNNIPGKIVTQLRGSAEVDQRGLIITTSDFTKDAIQESKAQNKMPVSLVNGEKLLDLLIKHNIGVKCEEISVYSIDSDYFENEESEPNKKPIVDSSKNRSIWPLPGGVTNYVETLRLIIDALLNQNFNRKNLNEWFITELENVASEKAVSTYINNLKKIGILSIKNEEVFLTEEILEYNKTGDPEILYQTIANRIIGFSEIYEFLLNVTEPQTLDDIYTFLEETFNFGWQTTTQTMFRLNWLISIGKIKKNNEGYVADKN